MKLRTRLKNWANTIKNRGRKAEGDESSCLGDEATRKESELGPLWQASKATTAPPTPELDQTVVLVQEQQQPPLEIQPCDKAEDEDEQIGKKNINLSSTFALEIEEEVEQDAANTDTAESRSELEVPTRTKDEESEVLGDTEESVEEAEVSPIESTSSSLTIRPVHPSTLPTTTPIQTPAPTFTMPPQPTESDLRNLLSHLHSVLDSDPSKSSPNDTRQLLSRAKLALLHLNALLPTQNTSPSLLALARETLEIGALLSIRLRDAEGFVRYFQQVQPFYAVPDERSGGGNASGPGSNRSKITGLYLLLLLSQQNYLGFHMVLESLELLASGQTEEAGKMVDDEYVRYPVRLERALMEGSYDRVWGEITGNKIPGPEFALFSEVCGLLAQRRDANG
jgi:hypothetical protein